MKFLLADDHPVVRMGLKAMLNQLEANAEVLEAADIPSVLALLDQHANDVSLVLLDLLMPGMDDFTGLRTVKQRVAACPVVIVSSSEDVRQVRQALDCGAAGYLLKSSPPSVLVQALRLVLCGGVYLPPIMLENSADSMMALRTTSTTPVETLLTGRQRQILLFMRNGLSNREIADRLGVSEATVKGHVTQMLKLLGVPSRAKAVHLTANWDLESAE